MHGNTSAAFYVKSILGSVFLLTSLLAAVTYCAAQDGAAQNVTEEQQKELKRIKKWVDEAGDFYKREDYKKSASRVRSAQARMIKLAESGDPDVLEALNGDYDRIRQARKLLTKQGQKFAELKKLEEYVKEPSEPGDEPDSDRPMASVSQSGKPVSFTKQVAPILVKNCAGCHIRQSKGEFSAATYVSLKKPAAKGTPVKPKDPKKSSLVTLVESGKMPPGRRTVSNADLQVLKSWVAQGAKFDGDDEDANLTTYVSDDSNQRRR